MNTKIILLSLLNVTALSFAAEMQEVQSQLQDALYNAIDSKNLSAVEAAANKTRSSFIINTPYRKGLKPLQYAWQAAPLDPPIWDALVRAGAQLDKNQLQTYLIEAAQRGQSELVRWLLKHGAKDDGTALRIAKERLKYFEENASPDLSSKLSRGFYGRMVDFLEGKGMEEPTPQDQLYTAIIRKDVDALKNVIGRAKDVLNKPREGKTPLNTLSYGRSRKPEILDVLFENGAKLDSSKLEDYLWAETVNGHEQSLDWLIKHGAKDNGRALKSAQETLKGLKEEKVLRT